MFILCINLMVQYFVFGFVTYSLSVLSAGFMKK